MLISFAALSEEIVLLFHLAQLIVILSNFADVLKLPAMENKLMAISANKMLIGYFFKKLSINRQPLCDSFLGLFKSK